MHDSDQPRGYDGDSMVGPAPSPRSTALLAVLLAVSIFVLDVRLPLAVSVPLLYVPVVLLGLWSPRRRLTLAAAALATLLTLAGAVLSAPGTPLWQGLVDRPLSVLTIWTTALLIVRYKAVEAGLREERRQAGAYLDIAAVALVALDRDGRVTLVNPRGCEIVGRSSAELLGADWFELVMTEPARETARASRAGLLAGPLAPPVSLECPVRRPGGEERLVAWDTTVTRDATGQVNGTLSSGEDRTDQRRAEEALVRQQALARLGRMAAVIAHEIRNPLAGIRGAVQIIGGRLPPDTPERAAVASIVERLDGLAEMAQSLLAFARPRPPRLEPLRLGKLLGEVAALVASDRRLSAVRVDVSGPDPEIAGDAQLLRGAFLNLLLNAAQAMNAEGTIRVSVSAGDGGCAVRIADEGPGIPPDLRDRIFEPFFTTRHRGTGLGLAIVRGNVEAHRGAVALECPPGGGTVVTVSLPVEQPGSPRESPTPRG